MRISDGVQTCALPISDLAFLPSGDFPHANRSHDRQIGFEAPFHQPFDFLYCAPFEHMFEPAIAAFEQPWLWRKQEERPQRNLSANAALHMGMPPAKRFSGRADHLQRASNPTDRKSTRLNSSH